jgi:5-methylcytosine-specific restriction protein B
MIVDLSKVQEEENEYEPYTKEDFLRDVFMDESAYERLVSILRIKKNLILKGAPGVGKTYAAKRLAYSIMGERNTERVKFVQFHQSYSYEDFVMGYRPNDSGGFVLRPGVFYQFCKKAELDPDHDYYFIIDEINRGNLSKVFGEVFVLIEADLREEEVRLAYREEMFSVPKNLYIIGMLNTADRSLSMIDYALRRRFSFVEIEPALDKLIKALNIDPKSKLGKLLEEVKNLNDDIKDDPSLGSGFRIGHSYFCNSEAVSDSNIFNVVKYEIIPMLEEYWFDNPIKATDWSERLRAAIT